MIINENSLARVVNQDGSKYESGHSNREDAFDFIKLWTQNVNYREAVIIDQDSGEIVLSLRTLR
jgi:hypothetical protein